MSNVLYTESVETQEDVIIVSLEIARSIERGELTMPTYGTIQKSNEKEQNDG